MIDKVLVLVVQLLKSWEYKNGNVFNRNSVKVVQLLKSWEYKNNIDIEAHVDELYSYLNLESTKT